MSAGVDFTNILQQFLCAQIPKAQTYTDDFLRFLRLWDLRAQKLLVKCW